MTHRNYFFHARATNFVRDIEKIRNNDADVKSRVAHVMVRRFNVSIKIKTIHIHNYYEA